jgi:hypothetical protein
MKKLLFIILFVLTFSLSASAIDVTVAATTITNYRLGGTTARLRIVANDNFFNSSGRQILRGNVATNNFYGEVVCTVAGTTVSCPSIVVDSTVDSSHPLATYSAYLISQKNHRTDYLLNFKVPTSFGAAITWQQVSTYSHGLPHHMPTTYYTADQINQLIAAIPGLFFYFHSHNFTHRPQNGGSIWAKVKSKTEKHTTNSSPRLRICRNRNRIRRRNFLLTAQSKARIF